MGFINSLFVGRGMGSEFGGLTNYLWLLRDKEFWNSLKITFTFTVIYALLSGIVGLLLAVTLNGLQGKLSDFYKALIFIPYIVALVVIGLIWKYMFNDFSGILNYFLRFLGLRPLPWLKTPSLALLSLIIVQVWYTIGYNMVLFLSGLQALPKDYYEAAEIDGAGSWHKLIYITVPLLVPTIVFVGIMSMLNGFVNVFALAKIITGGGPVSSTNVLMLYIYDIAFGRSNLPLANALTIIVFVIMAFLSFLQYKAQEKTIFGLD